MGLLIHNGSILLRTVGGGVFAKGWLHLRNGAVESAGTGGPPPDLVSSLGISGSRVVDCEGGLVVPAMTNAHSHLAQSFARAQSQAPDLTRWLNEIRPSRTMMNPQELYCATRLGLLENLVAGVGTVVDHFKCTNSPEHFDAAIAAAESSRMRVLVVRGYRDGTSHGFDSLSAAKEDLNRHKVRLGGGSRVSIGIGPTTLLRCDPDGLIHSATFAESNGMPLHLHIAETADEVAHWLAITQTTPVDWLDRNAALGPLLHLVHCAHINDGEIRAIARSRALVVVCPTSELRLRTGLPPMTKLMGAGARLAVATDGQASTGSQDILESLRLLMLTCDETPPEGHPDTSRWASMLYARLCPTQTEADDATGFAKGDPADVTVLHAKTCRTLPVLDPMNTLAYCMSPNNVRMVIVGGDILFEDGEATMCETKKFLDECLAASDRLRERIRQAESVK